MPLRTVTPTRYVTPLREGGSLPALVEADDLGLYVLKFRGAGQGPKALVAELVAGELARAAGLRVPELVLADLDPALAGVEPDPEIQDLLKASAGTNLALDFLPGSLTFTPGAGWLPPPQEAASVVWLDTLVENVDRTPQNPNLLVWHDELWCIDHGAALYRQHATSNPVAGAAKPFRLIGRHVLLPHASSLTAADAALAARVTPETVRAAVALVPPDWFGEAGPQPYVDALTLRLTDRAGWVQHAEAARAAAVAAAPAPPAAGFRVPGDRSGA